MSQPLSNFPRRHLLLGWFGLLLFLSMGIALEMMHGFKVGYYLDVQNSSRRLMWTLAHTHGSLFSLIHIAFAHSVMPLGQSSAILLRIASNGLTGALICLPLGFFAGGLWTYGGDPGLGILLVPVGALFLLSGVGAFCVELWHHSHAEPRTDHQQKKKKKEKRPGTSSSPRKKK